METNQPKWELVANLGDANPIDYGGYFVYRDTTGVYPAEAERLDSPESDNGEWTVRRVCLDRLELAYDMFERKLLVPFGFSERTDLPHPIARYNEWFADGLESVANYVGMSLDELRNGFCSEDPVERAFAYQAVGDYHGWENLDSYPLTFANRSEVEARYAEKNVKA